MKTLYIVLTFCAGLFLGYLIFPSHKNNKPPSEDIITKAESRLNTIDTIKLAGEVELQKKNEKLSWQLAVVNLQLKDHKERLNAERQKVFSLTDQLTANCDTLVSDSLKKELTYLNMATDSIICSYDAQDSLDHQMVAIRDTQLVICSRTYQYLKDMYREQEQREIQLTADLNTALKENKRSRFANKLLAAGMLFVSGLVTTLYIKSK